jgi:predicted DNA-binding transcriptional regulator AlpA
MTALDAFRALVDAAPADGMLTVPASWCRAALEGSAGGQGAPAGPERLLTAAEVAERLGWSARSVYRRGKTWPFAVRLGRTLRFNEAGLTKWLVGRSTRGRHD